MDPDLILKALQATREGRSYAFATVVESTKKGTPRKAGAKMIVLEDGSLFGSIGGGRNERAAREECLKALKTGKPFMATYDYFGQEGQSVCGGQIKVFIEPFIGKKNFIICGGGHIGLPLSIVGKMLNFRVTILDHRSDYANKKRFPHADQIIVGSYAEKLAKLTIDQNTFIMIVTPGNEHDFECLKAVINSEASYIGVISSRAKKVKFFKRLKDLGTTAQALNRIDIPAGIDLGAQTPEEIAISIAAKIIGLQHKSLIGSDKFK